MFAVTLPQIGMFTGNLQNRLGQLSERGQRIVVVEKGNDGVRGDACFKAMRVSRRRLFHGDACLITTDRRRGLAIGGWFAL